MLTDAISHTFLMVETGWGLSLCVCMPVRVRVCECVRLALPEKNEQKICETAA